MSEILNYILNALNSIPGDVWGYIITLIVAALPTSGIVMAIKKWFSVDGEKKMLTITIIGSMAASAVAYLQSTPEFAPWFVILQGWLVFATTQPVYYLFIKPLTKKLEVYWATQIAKYATTAEAKNAAVPAGGLNVPTPAADVDFSR